MSSLPISIYVDTPLRVHRFVMRRSGTKVMHGLLTNGISNQQQALMEKHGTPAGFAIACYELVPGTISMDEAKAAVEKYQSEWDAAGDGTEHSNTPRTWDEIPGYRGNMR